MPYCENCGSQINPDSKFCRNCGAKQNSPVQAPPSQPQQAPVQPAAPAPTPIQQPLPPVQAAPTPQPAPPVQVQPASFVQAQPPQQKTVSGQVIGAIVLKKPKSFGRWDTFTGVITNQQFIIAQMTSEMLKNATNEAKEQAKADGKGFWGQWSEQLKASFGYTKRYFAMEPAAIIAETPGNFALENSSIREFKLKLKHIQGQGDYNKEWEVEIHSSQGKYEFKMDDNPEFVETLKKAYPDRVRLPIGYFSKTININL